jgi:hypothetical protein
MAPMTEPLIKYMCSNKLLNPECEAVPTRSIPALTARYHLAGRPAPVFFSTKQQCDTDEKHGCAAVDTSIQMAMARAAATNQRVVSRPAFATPPSQLLLPADLQKQIGGYLDYNALASASNSAYITTPLSAMQDRKVDRRRYLDVTRNLPMLQKSYDDAKRLLDSYNIPVTGTGGGDDSSEAAALIRSKRISLDHLSELLSLILNEREGKSALDFPSSRGGDILKVISQMNLQKFVPRSLRSRLIRDLVEAVRQQYSRRPTSTAQPYLTEMMKTGWIDTVKMAMEMLFQFKEVIPPFMSIWVQLIASQPELFKLPENQELILREYRSSLCSISKLKPFFDAVPFTDQFVAEKELIDSEYLLKELLDRAFTIGEEDRADLLNQATEVYSPLMHDSNCTTIARISPEIENDPDYLQAFDRFLAKIITYPSALMDYGLIDEIVALARNRQYIAAKALIDHPSPFPIWQRNIDAIAEHCRQLALEGDFKEERKHSEQMMCQLTDWSKLLASPSQPSVAGAATSSTDNLPYLLSSAPALGPSLA